MSADGPVVGSPHIDALLRSVVTDDADLSAALGRVARVGRELVASCVSASVTIIERGRAVTVGSTDAVSELLDGAQYEADDGPCLDAARAQRLVRVDDLDGDERWPAFRAHAAAAGVRSSLAVPLRLASGDTVGALNLYGDVAGGFSDTDEELGRIFATQASVVLTNAHAYWAALDQARNLSIAMESRAVIEQAKGILMVVHQVGPDVAFDILRQRSQALNRKLHTVAADVVAEASGSQHPSG